MWKEDCGQYDGAEQVLLSTGFQLDIQVHITPPPSTMTQVFYPYTIPFQDEETVIVMQEPSAERDMDGWSTWFDNLNSCIKCLEVAILQL